jgi:DNA polymerase III subunit delta
VKASKAQVEKLLDAGGGDCRLFLLYGPDEAGSRALVARLARALGPDAERVDVEGSSLNGDAGRLAAEAASMSLFGGKRWILVTIAGRDDPLAAIEALLDADAAGNPVVMLAGGLKGTSPVVKRANADAHACALASYIPNDREFAEIATVMAREQGLRLANGMAQRLVSLAGQDRAVLTREIEKLALYLDAAPARPKDANLNDLDDIAADAGEAELSDLADAVFGGRPDKAAALLAMLGAEGMDGIGVLRALSRRMQLLLKLRGEMAGGKSLDAVTAPLFFKEKAAITAQLNRWSPGRLATASDRMLAAERAIKASGSPGPLLADAALIEISRAARR